MIQNKDPKQLEQYRALIRQADHQLNEEPYSVMNKTGVPPSKDKHLLKL